jgi:hypothetical protein
MQEKSGKRVIIETVYHYGAMLILLDRMIPSVARERIVTCYIRYMGSSASPNSPKICKLVKSTGYSINKATNQEVIPEKYPALMFQRFKVNERLVESFINAMKDDDIYEMSQVYGNLPHHRSLALSSQAQIIFTLLPFVPKVMDD